MSAIHTETYLLTWNSHKTKNCLAGLERLRLNQTDQKEAEPVKCEKQNFWKLWKTQHSKQTPPLHFERWRILRRFFCKRRVRFFFHFQRNLDRALPESIQTHSNQVTLNLRRGQKMINSAGYCRFLQNLRYLKFHQKNLPTRTFLYGLDLCAMVAEAPRWLEPQATRVLFHQAGYKLLLDPVDSLEVKMEIFACVSTMTLEKLLPKVSLCLVKCVLMYSPNSSLNEQIVGPNIWFHTPTAGDTLLLHSAVAQRKGERSNPPGGGSTASRWRLTLSEVTLLVRGRHLSSPNLRLETNWWHSISAAPLTEANHQKWLPQSGGWGWGKLGCCPKIGSFSKESFGSPDVVQRPLPRWVLGRCLPESMECPKSLDWSFACSAHRWVDYWRKQSWCGSWRPNFPIHCGGCWLPIPSHLWMAGSSSQSARCRWHLVAVPQRSCPQVETTTNSFPHQKAVPKCPHSPKPGEPGKVVWLLLHLKKQKQKQFGDWCTTNKKWDQVWPRAFCRDPNPKTTDLIHKCQLFPGQVQQMQGRCSSHQLCEGLEMAVLGKNQWVGFRPCIVIRYQIYIVGMISSQIGRFERQIVPLPVDRPGEGLLGSQSCAADSARPRRRSGSPTANPRGASNASAERWRTGSRRPAALPWYWTRGSRQLVAEMVRSVLSVLASVFGRLSGSILCPSSPNLHGSAKKDLESPKGPPWNNDTLHLAVLEDFELGWITTERTSGRDFSQQLFQAHLHMAPEKPPWFEDPTSQELFQVHLVTTRPTRVPWSFRHGTRSVLEETRWKILWDASGSDVETHWVATVRQFDSTSDSRESTGSRNRGP